MTDDLPALPIAQINADNLRLLCAREVAQIIASQPVAEEWSEVSRLIDGIVFIEDAKTGGVNPGDRRAIYTLIRALRPRRVLEIGTHVGASTIHIAAAMKKNGSSGDALVTVDIADVNSADAYWKQCGLSRSPRDSVAQLGIPEYVTFVTQDSLGYFDGSAEKFDFIFLDGDHSASMLYREMPRALSHLAGGGVILLHDYFPDHRPLWIDGAVIPGPFLALQRLQAEGANLKVHPLGSLPWPTKLGSNITSLALLSR